MYFDTFTLACVLSTASALVVNSTRPATEDDFDAIGSTVSSAATAASSVESVMTATSDFSASSETESVLQVSTDATDTAAASTVTSAPAVETAVDNSTEVETGPSDGLHTALPGNATDIDDDNDADYDAGADALVNDTIPLLTPVTSNIAHPSVIPLAAPNDTAVDISPDAIVKPGPLPSVPVLADGSTNSTDELLHGLNIDVDPTVIVNNGFSLSGNNNTININTSIILPININLTVNAWVDPLLAPSVTYTKLVTECCLGSCLIKTVPYCPTMPVATVSSCPGQCTTTSTECPYCVLATGCSTLTTVCSNTPVTVYSPWCTYTVPPNPPECTPIVQTVTPGGKVSTATRLVPVPIATKLPPKLPAPSETPCPIAPIPMCSGECVVPEKPPLPVVPSATNIPIAQPSGNPIPQAPVCPELPAKPQNPEHPSQPKGTAPSPESPKGTAPAPETPKNPEAPKNPENPEAPQNPENPEAPKNPSPGAPENPSPEAPKNPGPGAENPPPSEGGNVPPAPGGEGNPPATGPAGGNPPPPATGPAGSNAVPPAQATSSGQASPPPAQGSGNRLAVTGLLVGVIGIAMLV